MRILYCDSAGITRGKAVSTSTLGDRLRTGVGMTTAAQALTMLDHLAPVPGMGPVGEVRLVADPATFVVVPYAPHTGAVVADLMTIDGQPSGADGRGFLRRMIERAAAYDLEVLAALEPEWSLGRWEGAGLVPFDESLAFDADGMQAAAEVVDDVLAALEEQGISVEQYHPEVGPGQQELSIRHAPALHAADQHLLYRQTVRAVARRHGLLATFAPKPWEDKPGNGCHLHLSARDLQRSGHAFYDPDGIGGLSRVARHFAAGVLSHLPALVALTCASVNSYRRLRPGACASPYRVWGFDNREAALRIPSPFRGREAQSMNIELKASDASANPYISLGGVIAAGLDGLERALELPPPLDIDPSALSESDLALAGCERLPCGLHEALDRLRNDEVLLDALGHDLARTYLAVKDDDVAAFAAETVEFELRQHWLRY